MSENIRTLLTEWRETHDEMTQSEQPFRARMIALQDQIYDIEMEMRAQCVPDYERLEAIEAELCPMIEAHAATFKMPGVEARFRKGAKRVTYKWQTVDAVRDVLRDVLPESANTLDKARKESIGKPSVKVVRV